MNRTLVGLTGATAIAAAMFALSAPVLADGGHGRGGNFSTGGHREGEGNRGGSRSQGGNRSSGGGQMSSGGSRSNSNSSNSDSGRSSGNAGRYNRGSNNSGTVNSSGGAPRYGNGQLRSGGRNVEGNDRAGNSRNRSRPPSGNFVYGGSTPAAPSSPALSGSNPSNSTFRSGRNDARDGAISRGNFRSNPNNNNSDRHYGTPRVPGIPSSGRYNNRNSPGYGYGHRPGRVWYGNRPYWGWNGGYWRGSYWPRAHYRHGFVGFVTLLPPVYSTYWYGGTSYYYANDLYYTWNPDRYGYVVTNPPPVEEASASYSTAPDTDDNAQGTGPGDIFVYPRNGQSEEQTAQDRYECHQWAVNQTGFDPTLGEAQSGTAQSPEDYRRAIIACLDGRGYSAN